MGLATGESSGGDDRGPPAFDRTPCAIADVRGPPALKRGIRSCVSTGNCRGRRPITSRDRPGAQRTRAIGKETDLDRGSRSRVGDGLCPGDSSREHVLRSDERCPPAVGTRVRRLTTCFSGRLGAALDDARDLRASEDGPRDRSRCACLTRVSTPKTARNAKRRRPLDRLTSSSRSRRPDEDQRRRLSRLPRSARSTDAQVRDRDPDPDRVMGGRGGSILSEAKDIGFSGSCAEARETFVASRARFTS